jgi:hypothetical protein
MVCRHDQQYRVGAVALQFVGRQLVEEAAGLEPQAVAPALRLARVVGLDLERDIIKRLAEKKASELILWDSSKRAAKGALGPADGSRAMIDALHHAAHLARTRNLDAARELLTKTGVDKNPALHLAMEAVLAVLPVGSAFTKVVEEKGPVSDAASDFDVLEHLRRLAFNSQVRQPEQLKFWES